MAAQILVRYWLSAMLPIEMFLLIRDKCWFLQADGSRFVLKSHLRRKERARGRVRVHRLVRVSGVGRSRRRAETGRRCRSRVLVSCRGRLGCLDLGVSGLRGGRGGSRREGVHVRRAGRVVVRHRQAHRVVGRWGAGLGLLA